MTELFRLISESEYGCSVTDLQRGGHVKLEELNGRTIEYIEEGVYVGEFILALEETG